MKPVAVPPIKAGVDAKVLAGQALVALDKANGRITSGAAWYASVRKDYGPKK